jgi:hypothetical protein
LLFFHGNGETAEDVEYAAPIFSEMGVSLFVADYRGYGWSDDKPLASKLLSDAEATFSALLELLAQDNLGKKPLFIHGRSLGGAPAIHLTALFPERIAGLILESTFAHAPLLLSTMGIPKGLLRIFPPFFASERKIATLKTTPLLIFHGERDEVIPVEHGQMLFDSALTPHKQLIRIPNVGHNNLVSVAHKQYFETIREFINANI